MFIQTEDTPNPETMIFRPGRPVLGQGAMDFPNAETAVGRSVLVENLFGVEGVKAVFLGDHFLSITKGSDCDWTILKAEILGVLLEHFATDAPILSDSGSSDSGADLNEAEGHFDEADRDTVDSIKELLETRVRPAVARDGGDIVFHGFERGVVYLSMRGACAGCPSSTYTLKMGIENMLRHYVPEVTEVRQA
ncbi:MAG: NifU family protein [Pseudomonadota bacterium]